MRLYLFILGILAGSLVGCFASSTCDLSACTSTARLRGEVKLPEAATTLNAKYCSPSRCIEKVVDLGTPPACFAGGIQEGLCIKRIKNDRFSIDANLTQVEDGRSPADGEKYTLTIGDAESGETLIDETRRAVYDRTRTNECHTCWDADLRL